jgi:hypothetical protein
MTSPNKFLHCVRKEVSRRRRMRILEHLFNLLAPELFFLILWQPVYKMWIIQEPNKLELWNKLYFEEEKNGEYTQYTGTKYVRIMKQTVFWRGKKRRVYNMFKIFSIYICWINI